MIFKIETDRESLGHTLHQVNYIRAEAVEHLQDMGQGQAFINFHDGSILCRKDDPGVPELFTWFEKQVQA